jgi:hypothetical protein
MNMRHLILSTALALASMAPASAGELRPGQAEGIDLGTALGMAYYTAEPDGFRVVVTLAQQDEATLPVRFEALLVPGQSIVLSTPRERGAGPEAVEISQRDNAVLVRAISVAATN